MAFSPHDRAVEAVTLYAWKVEILRDKVDQASDRDVCACFVKFCERLDSEQTQLEWMTDWSNAGAARRKAMLRDEICDVAANRDILAHLVDSSAPRLCDQLLDILNQ